MCVLSLCLWVIVIIITFGFLPNKNILGYFATEETLKWNNEAMWKETLQENNKKKVSGQTYKYG